MSNEDASAYTRSWSSREVSFLTLSAGPKLRYLKVGKGPPLVLIHTVRTQLDLFQRLIPLLVGGYTVYAVDLPGFGWSDIVPGASYTEPALRARILDFIRTLGLKDVTLAGESIGAVLALTLAASPDIAVRRVVAFNPYDYLPGLERANLLASVIIKSVRAPMIGPLFAAMENRLILKGIISGGFSDPSHLPASFIDELSKSGSRAGYSSVARATYRALPSFVDARSLYDQVRAPISLVYGEQDWSSLNERDVNKQNCATRGIQNSARDWPLRYDGKSDRMFDYVRLKSASSWARTASFNQTVQNRLPSIETLKRGRMMVATVNT